MNCIKHQSLVLQKNLKDVDEFMVSYFRVLVSFLWIFSLNRYESYWNYFTFRKCLVMKRNKLAVRNKHKKTNNEKWVFNEFNRRQCSLLM